MHRERSLPLSNKDRGNQMAKNFFNNEQIARIKLTFRNSFLSIVSLLFSTNIFAPLNVLLQIKSPFVAAT